MNTSFKRWSPPKPLPALVKKAAGYIALVIGAAFLVKGLQLLSILDPCAQQS